MPDVIIIRGAPGSGKSEAAKCLAARLGKCVRLEVDTLRAMIIPVDWTNQMEHINVLTLAADLVAGFLRIGHRPVIVVDTFSGDKQLKFLADLETLQPGLDVCVFALVAAPAVLRERIESRSPNQFKYIGISEKQNSEIIERPQPGEQLIDNSGLTPDEVVDLIIEVRG